MSLKDVITQAVQAVYDSEMSREAAKLEGGFDWQFVGRIVGGPLGSAVGLPTPHDRLSPSKRTTLRRVVDDPPMVPSRASY